MGEAKGSLGTEVTAFRADLEGFVAAVETVRLDGEEVVDLVGESDGGRSGSGNSLG